jgi:hypothetical protein
MENIIEILKPNTFKIIFSALVFIPICALLIAVSYPHFWTYQFNFYYNTPFNFVYLPSLALTSLGIGYFIASFIDHYIPNKNVKLTIAIISGLVTLIIIYIFYKMISEPLVCDPVHTPAQGAGYTSKILNDISVDKDIVEESLKQCLAKFRW